jgi:regulator of cell morphogenesis and NO signaling
MMESGHIRVPETSWRIVRTLTGNYTAPDDGCATLSRLFRGTRGVATVSLRMHIHLENNILFPKAMALESALTGAPAR